jgi:hypothetical protein
MANYYKYTSKARMDKAINTLLGILEGITIDSLLNEKETGYLGKWLLEHEEYAQRHPFNELLPVISKSLQDNVLSAEEHEEIVWLCEKLRSTEYYSDTTADLQRLQSILSGISADGIITKNELEGLTDWLAEHEHLKTCYPYDEVDSLISSILSDQKIDPEEHNDLLEFFGEFTNVKPKGSDLSDKGSYTLKGICAASPAINFHSSVFCFTGEARKKTRDELSSLVIQHGGSVTKGVSKKINYLVVGSNGNPCWMYACYGLKIERAMALRKEGHAIVIVHEIDFLDAIVE